MNDCNKKCTNGHVWLASCIDCLGHRVNKVATDAEVTYLHFSVAVDENIWRFHVTMYHFELGLKVVQCLYNLCTTYLNQTDTKDSANLNNQEKDWSFHHSFCNRSMLPRQPILETKLAYRPSFVTLAFRIGLEYHSTNRCVNSSVD